MKLKVLKFGIVFIVSGCAHIAPQDQVTDLSGIWTCESQNGGVYEIKRERELFLVYQVSNESITAMPGDLVARFSYNKSKSKFIGQHTWSSERDGPRSWGEPDAMEITVKGDNEIRKVYLDSVYTGGWTCRRGGS